MIARKFYNDTENIAKVFLGGKRQHYMPRPSTTVVKAHSYIIQGNESIYDIAIQVFGEEQQNLWYMIADSNDLRPIDEWESGDEIMLPELIVQETDSTHKRKTLVLGKLSTAKFQ